MRKLLLVAISFSLLACADKSPSRAILDSSGVYVQSDLSFSDGYLGEQLQSKSSTESDTDNSGNYLAYRHNYSTRLPAANIKQTANKHIEVCQSAGRNKCQILQSNISDHSSTNVAASFSFRADPVWLESFFDQMHADIKNAKGNIESNTTSVEDLTTAILDSDARLQAQIALRGRLHALLETQDGSLADLLALEREIARVQGEIESATAVLKALRARISMSQVDIFYRSKNVALSGNAFSEVSYALKNFLTVLMNGLGGVILFLAYTLPWFIFIIAPGFLISRKLWRRHKNSTPVTEVKETS